MKQIPSGTDIFFHLETFGHKRTTHTRAQRKKRNKRCGVKPRNKWVDLNLNIYLDIMHTSDDESAKDFNLQITKIKRKRKAIVSSRQVFRRITEQLDSLVQQPCSNTSSVVQNDFHGIVDNARNVDVLATKFSNDYNDTNFTTGESSRLNSDQSFSAKNLDFDCPLCLSCSCVSCDICCHFDDCENFVHCIKCVEDVDDHFSDPEPKSSSEESDDPEVLSSDNLLARTIKNDFIAIIHKHNLNHTVVEDICNFSESIM
ncbi:hypothetical protein FQR65_LT15897 [Abscondita terminalis]|nr:hypothetical protein FQR65_LT15897 [Abscondita terminalis]